MTPRTETPARPLARTAALLSISGFVALALVVWHATQPLAWERPIIDGIVRLPHPTRDFWIGMFEPVPFALTTMALGFAAAARGRTRLAVAGVVGCLTAVIMAELVFKPLVGRVRVHFVGVEHVAVRIGGNMFPSAHVTAAASLATFAWLVLDRGSRLRPLLIALPVIVGLSVISKHMHYPADVLGGALLGPTVVLFVVHAARRLTATATRPEIEAVDGSPQESVGASF